jgi:hypothetical protein
LEVEKDPFNDNITSEADLDDVGDEQTPTATLSQVLDEESEQIKFAFSLKSPKISLLLLTDARNRNPKALAQFWTLSTELQGLSCSFAQSAYENNMSMSLYSLKVADNSGDERFPSIFEN